MLDEFVPLTDRIRWQMLRHAIDKGVTAKTLAARLGRRVKTIQGLVMDPERDIRLSDIAEWFFAVDGSMARFTLVPR